MISPVTIVIPGDDPPQLQGSPHLERLRGHGRVVLHADRPGSGEEKVLRAREAVCLINSRGAVKWPAEVLRRLPRLKMISVCGIGTDAVDLETAKELGITVCNLPGQTAPLVAEHALGLMLAVARRVQSWGSAAIRWSRPSLAVRGRGHALPPVRRTPIAAIPRAVRAPRTPIVAPPGKPAAVQPAFDEPEHELGDEG